MPQRLRSYRFVYAALFAVGISLLLIGALHPNIWYDESYSVALARWDWADIWRLDALDVHPPLYYLLLHAVHLLFGDSILAYRLFSVAGIVATAVLGLLVVRRLWGNAEGLIFSALILLLPNMQHMAWQIRMYAWAVFAATLCFLMVVRIARAERAGVQALWSTWAVFAVASLSCAYLHYYGTIAAFLMNAGLLVQLVLIGRHTPHAVLGGGVRRFVLQAIAQVALFLPWLFTFVTQVQSVASGYWITFTFPDSLLNIVFLPFKTDSLSQDDAILITAGLILVVTALLVSVHRFRFGDAWREVTARVDCAGHALDWSAVRSGIAVYAATIAIVAAASLAMGRVVLMYRYLVIVLGPLCVAAALALTRLARMAACGGSAFRSLRRGLRLFAIVFCVASIGVWGAVTASLFDPMTSASVETVRAARADGATVLTDSARVGGILAALDPGQRIIYLDFTEDAWWEPGVRRAYGGAVASVGSWGEALEQTGERALFISDRDSPRTVEELTRELASEGLRVEAAWRIVRPYDRVTWTFLACVCP